MSRKAFVVAACLSLSFFLASSSAVAALPSLGQNANLNGWRPFPANDSWNEDISAKSVDPLSDSIIATIGTGVGLHADFGVSYGIPYYVVSGSQRMVKVTNTGYVDEGDNMMMPIPPAAAIEGGGNGGNGDSHLLVLDRDNQTIYELYIALRQDSGRRYSCTGTAIFDANTNVLRPRGWTSCDAAGLPILPGLVKYQEIYVDKEVKHALRFTASQTRRAYLPPATHYASTRTGTQYIPMGAKVRLKASFNTAGYSAGAKVLLDGLKKYGLIMCDNGSNWYITGAGPDSRWNDTDMGNIRNCLGTNFEVVQMVGLVTG
jgi:hypothetical protein